MPSPTFSLAQVYETPRLPVTHFDFYRLSGADEARELGFEEAVERGAAIVEWPERAAELLPAEPLRDRAGRDGRRRRAARHGARARAACAATVRRIGELAEFLETQQHWRGARIAYLQGDASTRSYARLFGADDTAILMDAPIQPDGPPIRDGRSYSRIAHLAENMVRPFVAVGSVLRGAGLSAPAVPASDLEQGILLVEDLGDRVFAAQLAAGASQAELWRAAVDALIRLRGVPLPARLPLPDGTSYTLPRRDRAAFEIEIELLLDWYWPAVKGAPAPRVCAAEFRALWAPVLDRLLALPGGWFLRDYHSPNLIWLPERAGVARVGIIDFQDALDEHFAFDLVSLLQDARVAVPEALEKELFAYYCAEVASARARLRSGGFFSRLCRLRRPAQHAAAGLVGAPAAAGRQAALHASGAAHLGISAAQPARARTRRAGGVVRPALAGSLANRNAVGLRRRQGRGEWPARSKRRWSWLPGSARAWRCPATTRCPSRSYGSPARR